MQNRVLVTGAAGFIGFHLCKKLAAHDYDVTGLDNLNDYYDTELKVNRLHELGFEENVFSVGSIYNSWIYNSLRFIKLSLEDRNSLQSLFEMQKFDYVINLAAQAGVRFSLENPHAYIDSNIVGFVNILEGCRHNPVKHLIFASSSSVYGANKIIPFSEEDRVDYPVSLYAATKKSNELLAHSYSHLYGIPISGLRLFTVYGPWGRPDMAYYSFTKNIINDEPIKVFNNGMMKRDFTYVDDVINSIMLLFDQPPDKIESGNYRTDAKFKIYNLGNSSPVNLDYFIKIIEEKTGKKAKIEYLPLQPGDMLVTYADTGKINRSINYKPLVKIDEGLARFVSWYKTYNNIKEIAESFT